MFPETQCVSGLMVSLAVLCTGRCRQYGKESASCVRRFPRGQTRGGLAEFTVIGAPCMGLNVGLQFQYSEACSFQVASDDQAETDRLWRVVKISGVQKSECGRYKDR
jgi:predicted 3-demethylubiquinone-9 3-methyltransferase (glyoxalase superfamily)